MIASHFAQASPDPFGGLKPFPWFRVVHRSAAGEITPVYDFIMDANIAMALAHKKDAVRHECACCPHLSKMDKHG